MKEQQMITLQDVDNSNFECIRDSCKSLDLDHYMSRFYPEMNQTVLWYLILLDSKEIGHIWIEKCNQKNNENKLGIVIWEKSKRGIGIGHCAISKVIKLAALEHNIRTIVLNVRRSNHRAQKCYKKVGFQQYNKERINNSDESVPYIQMKYEI